MNILLVCNKFPFPSLDGGALASYNMVKGLVEAGNKVDLLAMNTSRHFSFNDTSGIDIKGMGRVVSVNIDNSFSYFGFFCNFLFSSIPYNAGLYDNSRFRLALAGMLREEAYDIVQLEGLYLLPYVETIRENTVAGISYRAHNVEHIIWGTYKKREKSRFRKFYLNELQKRVRNYEQNFINSYDLLATVTETDLEVLNSMGNEKPSIVTPFGMSVNEFPETRQNHNDNIFLQYIGALDWLPNIESLNWLVEKVWTVVKDKYPGLKFFVAGRNAGDSLVRKLTEKGIDFIGEVENSKDFLCQNSIFIVPLFSGSGIRVKIIEAMFMGKPIIATSFSISGIPAEHGEHILLADNEHAFIRCIDQLLTDQGYAKSLGMNAKNLAHNYFNNSTITGELTDFYKKHVI